MTISNKLPQGGERPEDLLGDARLMKALKTQLMERMPGAELMAHLGSEEGKEMPVFVPRGRDGIFEPELDSRYDKS